jgi:cytochrome b561
VAVLLVVVLRVLWLLRSPAPPLPHEAARAAALARSRAALTRTAHVLLYLAIAAMSISGLWLVLARGEALDLLGLHAAGPGLVDASSAAHLATWHGAVLPLALVGLITLHLAAVLKHPVVDGQRTAVRRMLG